MVGVYHGHMTPTTPGAGTTPEVGVFSQPTAHEEVWAPVSGHPFNEASTLGRIRSLPHVAACSNGRNSRYPGRVLRPYAKESGHLYVTLLSPRLRRMVHQLVLETFVGPAPEGMEACHNDGNPANNWVSNLRWDTHSGNMMDRRRHGTDHMASRIKCPWGHRLAAPNLAPSHLKRNHRACLACGRASGNQTWMRAKGIQIDFQAVSDGHYAEILAGRAVSRPGPRPATDTCSECDRRIQARGMCKMHYQIWWRAQPSRKAA